LDYWKSRKQAEGQLGNAHYEYYYTTYFGIDREFYRSKRVLDIGCGPRGSLEWADMAAERVGLDPLVPAYRKLGIDHHKMNYCAARSERIPFPDSYFDVVTSVNSLDHVDDVQETIQEITRVTKPNGVFLVVVEINHRVRVCEPHCLHPDFIKSFLPAFSVKSSGLFGGEIQSKAPYPGTGPGYFSARLTKRP
jgi:ubiquinone/menaquinone biosynthesis C-methylase UbiE